MTSQMVLVAGADGGIGRDVVEGLLDSGHKVFATDLHTPKSFPTDTERLLVHQLDVRNHEDWRTAIERMVSTWGRIDVLIQLAGYQKAGVTAEAPVDEVSKHLEVNLQGTIIGTQLVLRQMLKQGAGHIVNVGSLGSLTPVPGLSLYAASKFGVRGFTLSLAHELRDTNIDVSLVCPGTVDTPMTTQQIDIPESAAIYSNALLTSEYVADIIVSRVLRDRPVEILIPRGFGLLAKFAGLFVGLGKLLAPSVIQKGKRNQARLQDRRSDR